MTENKRFTYMEQLNGFCDVYDNGKILSCMRLEYVENTVNLLNELHEENENLKHQLITLDGLYVSDKEDMSEVWRLDLFSDDTK